MERTRAMERRSRIIRAAAFLLLLAGARAARGDGLTLRAEPGYVVTHTDNVDQAGRSTFNDTSAFDQRYALRLDRTLYPGLVFDANGNFEKAQGTITDNTGSSSFDATTWNLISNLTLGSRVLGGGLTYAHREQFANSSVSTPGQVTIVTTGPKGISDTYSGVAYWRPLELPQLTLLANHLESHDESRKINDTGTSDVTLTASYNPARTVQTGYTVRYAVTDDRLHATESTITTQAARVAWADYLFERRSQASVSYDVSRLTASATSSGPGGTVTVQQFPVAGLSIVEEFGTVPTTVTLKANPALVDGDLATSAGVDIGFTPTASGDSRGREVGIQFADALTRVTTLYVWVDRSLPAEVSSAYPFTVYRSDDNVSWSQVALAAPPVFAPFQNRFEITIPTTQARYLKVVTKPLSQGVTADPRFGDVFVTELQAFLVTSATSAAAGLSTTVGNLNATAVTRLLDKPGLSHDVWFGVSQHNAFAPDGYQLVNGLSLSHRFNQVFSTGGRVSRLDRWLTGVHDDQWTYSARLTADPLPTLGAALSYSGSATDLPSGTTISNSVSLSARADLYEGVSTLETFGYQISTNPQSVTSQSVVGTASLSVTPNRYVGLNVSAGATRSEISGGGQPGSETSGERLDGGLTVTPFPAVSGSAGASRIWTAGQPAQTLANFSVAWTPLRGGELVFSTAHSESLDTLSNSTTRVTAAGLQWNIRPGWNLNLSYNQFGSDSPAGSTTTRAFSARLLVTI